MLHKTLGTMRSTPLVGGGAADDYTAKQLAYSPTAVDCHRYVAAGDTNAEDKDQNGNDGLPDDYEKPGWNNVTPW